MPRSEEGAAHPRWSKAQALQTAAGARWHYTGDLITARTYHAATLLLSGKVLVTGGQDPFLAVASAEVYDPATGGWSPAGALASARVGHTATLLPSGKVLATGGNGHGRDGLFASAEVYDPATGDWSPTGALAAPRSGHTATLLPSGKVLVTGGWGPGGFLASAEVYDPATGDWSPTGALPSPHLGHTATLLPSGKVLATGGLSSGSSAQVYDPATGEWSPTGALATGRALHTATLLPSGKVLVIGGVSGGSIVSSAEVYDPATGEWSPTGAPAMVRESFTATLLPSGKVLVTGSGGPSAPLAGEVYDPATGEWSLTAAPATVRYFHTATLLPTGKVLVTGGEDLQDSTVTIANSEVYDPGAGEWNSAGALATERYFHTATLLPSGKVLVTGGEETLDPLTSEVYDPATREWGPAGAPATARRLHTATLLPSGKVLVTGGETPYQSYLASAEVYDPATGVWSSTGALATERYFHTATLLPSGKVLVTGGKGPPNAVLASAEVYDPATGEWSSTGPLSTARFGHTATLLPSGRVLVTGGKGPPNVALASAEMYDPATGEWSPTGALATTRSGHTATLLPSGEVLVTGGSDPRSRPVREELYNPATGEWSLTGALATTRSGHTATLLPSGQVLVTGGSSSEVYDPATGEWSPTSALVTPLSPSTATLLPSGQVLITGNLNRSTQLYEDTEVGLEWRPVITPPAEQHPGEGFRIMGSRLRGLSEASSGNSQNSATNLPVVSLLALEGGKLTYVTALNSISETEVSGRTPMVPNGHYILSVVVNGIQGGQLVLVNGPPPSVPTITSPWEFTNTQRPVIAGTAVPQSTVVVWLDGSVAGRAQANAQGQWSFTLAHALAEGLHRAVAVAMDSVGNLSPGSEECGFTVDTVPPEAPVMSASGDFVNTQRPVMTGMAEPGGTVKVLLDDDETSSGTVEVDASGVWSFTPATALSEGLHQVRATTQDKAGNISRPSVARVFTVDTVRPAVPEVTSPAAFVNTSRPTVAGTAEAGSVVTVWLGEAVAGTAVADSHGTWSVILATTLSDGDYQVKATATDAASNLSPDSEQRGFTVDTEPPAAPVVISPEGSIETRTPVIRGMVEPGSTVKVWLGDNEASAQDVIVDLTGDWRFIPSSALDFGHHTVSAIAVDVAGNLSAPAQRQFSIQRSHYGWSCTSAASVPATWALVLLALSLGGWVSGSGTRRRAAVRRLAERAPRGSRPGRARPRGACRSSDNDCGWTPPTLREKGVGAARPGRRAVRTRLPIVRTEAAERCSTRRYIEGLTHAWRQANGRKHGKRERMAREPLEDGGLGHRGAPPAVAHGGDAVHRRNGLGPGRFRHLWRHAVRRLRQLRAGSEEDGQQGVPSRRRRCARGSIHPRLAEPGRWHHRQ